LHQLAWFRKGNLGRFKVMLVLNVEAHARYPPKQDDKRRQQSTSYGTVNRIVEHVYHLTASNIFSHNGVVSRVAE